MRKRIGSIEEMHPLTLTIDTISAIPSDIKVVTGENDSNLNGRNNFEQLR